LCRFVLSTITQPESTHWDFVMGFLRGSAGW